MRRLALVLVIGGLCAGCATGWLRGATEDPQGPARRLTRAEELTREGQLSAARDLYEGLVREPARDAVHASALYKLARLYTDPSSGFLDYRAAQAGFERLLAEYPQNSSAADARAWRAMLLEIQARQAEAVRLGDEATRLKGDLKAWQAEALRLHAEAVKLKADLQAGEKEVARLKDETARLKAQRQRLKRIDLNFEHR
jgi:tetratricopeptide (TPR) repeat protein